MTVKNTARRFRVKELTLKGWRTTWWGQSQYADAGRWLTEKTAQAAIKEARAAYPKTDYSIEEKK
jgi:hypothetical protein